MIYDTFIFFNELDLLELRLNILDTAVDKFILVEATKTFQGNPKQLFYENNKSRFAKFSDKIIHIIVDDLPVEATPWDREYFQRNSILRGLVGCVETDLILISDLDEIPNPDVIPLKIEKNKIVFFRQKLFYYKLNIKCVELNQLPWSLVVLYDPLMSPTNLRKKLVQSQMSILNGSELDENITIIENGGWHFSYIGSPEQIISKIEAFSHDELNIDKYKNASNISESIENGKDIFGRNLSFVHANNDELPKYVADNMLAYFEKDMLNIKNINDHLLSGAQSYHASAGDGVLFDQYSRYKACADILVRARFNEGNTLLDIGSGEECLFGQFMQHAKMSYVDPLIPEGTSDDHINGDVFSSNLDGRTFDCVTAIDVLEHVPAEMRQKFLNRVASLAKEMVILAFPCSDTNVAIKVDRQLDKDFKEIYGESYSWLEEHYQYGLPLMSETEQQLTAMGWHCQIVGHGHAPWLRELLSFVICVGAIPSMSGFVKELSKEFNGNLYKYDFCAPHYRKFIIATRTPLSESIVFDETLDIAEGGAAFQAIISQAKVQYFQESLRQLSLRDNQIVELNRVIEEVSEWGKIQSETIFERDTQIVEQKRKLEEITKALSDKQAELMRMSDWAYGMMQDIKLVNKPLHKKLIHGINAAKQVLRGKLANTALGDLVRHNRFKRRYRANMVSIDAISRSLHENDGKLIITFPVITWDFRWQRPQHIVSRLRDNGYSILYLAMSLAPFQRSFRSDLEACAALQFNNLAPHINQVWLHSRAAMNIYTDALAGDDLHNVVSGLRALLALLKPKSIHYMIQFPGWWPVAEALRDSYGGSIVFDCMDDHGGFSTNTAQLLKTECSLIDQADLVITSSALLEDRCKVLNPTTIQVKNGTEFHHFHDPKPNGELDHLRGKPIIGYYGAISDWFDMDLVAYCAKRRPEWQFVLIGDTFGAELASVKGLPNVLFLGEKPYATLPGYLAYFDVCTIPFKLIPLTLATNPVKFYEYLSAGKPVVSIDLPELKPYAEDCYLACNADEFFEQLQRSLLEKDDPQKIASRFELAQANSWDARAKSMLAHPVFN